MIMLLLIYCLMYFPLLVRVLCLSSICYALLYAHSSFAIIFRRKRKLVALLLLSCVCLVTVNVLRLFLVVPWVGLQCMIVVFPDHTHLSFFYFDTSAILFTFVCGERFANNRLFHSPKNAFRHKMNHTNPLFDISRHP